jgi:hypothetical protein
LVLVNSRRGDGPVYNIFPLRVRLPAASAYYRAVRPVELADRTAITERIANAWHEGTATDRTGYVSALRRLRSPAAILQAAGLSRK